MSASRPPLTVAVAGATGAVGGEFIRLFEERDFPIHDLRLLASSRSVGKLLSFRGSNVRVEELTHQALEGVDIAFFSAGAGRSEEFAPLAAAAGTMVVDNSSAFRMDPNVPLIIPEVNGSELRDQRIVSVPNCTAIILCMALHPLRTLGTMDRIIASTYQSASGGGASMMHQLEEETRAVLAGNSVAPSTLNTRYAFNLFSHNTAIDENGSNGEEAKVMAETRKILGMPSLGINVTCVRVPVLRAHSVSVTIEFDGPAPSREAVTAAFNEAPGIRVIDDRTANRFPTPLDASGQGDVLVGRIRQDPSNPRAISLFITGDQLLKGAALNAVQIAELWLSQ